MAEAATAVALAPQRQTKSVLVDMATRFGMEPAAFEQTVRATVIKNASREELAAFLLVAKEYTLNPLTKEIYAFPAKGGGIVPVVSIDGWVNLINSHGACDGFEFEFDHADDGKLISCTCKMFRKDRTRPVVITEWLAECARSTEPWKMQHRMLRHKALIQAARYAFGFSGIYEEDEARRIIENQSKEIQGEFSEVDDGGGPPNPANDDGGGPPVPEDTGTATVAVVEASTTMDDGGGPPAPTAELIVNDDDLGIPDYLRRKPREVEPPQSERGWLEGLSAEFEKCETMGDLAEAQEQLMTPFQDRVSVESWDSACDILETNVARLQAAE